MKAKQWHIPSEFYIMFEYSSHCLTPNNEINARKVIIFLNYSQKKKNIEWKQAVSDTDIVKWMFIWTLPEGVLKM